jgi:type VI secretion system protein ImpG
MKLDEQLYKFFLEQMHELENFRMSYAQMHPTAPIEREDPDVKRLTEAMAFFASRTHLAGMRHIVALHQRVFQQFFPYLLAPLPAMGMIKPKLSGQFVETIFLPKGTQVAVTPETEGAAIFRTTQSLRILPISVSNMKTMLLPNKGTRLVLQLRAAYPRNDEIEDLKFQINHLNDYLASLRVFYELKKHLKRTWVVFDENVTEETSGTACEVSFGIPEADLAEDDEWPNPLQNERTFFHFPQQELFLNVRIASQPHTWTEFTICFDLDSKWPRNLTLNQDVFQLFAVPIENLNRSMAQPILYDGTQERFLLMHADMDKRFNLHSVLGVYQVLENKTSPIRAGILSGGAGSYEIEHSPDKAANRRYRLSLNFPEAFKDPRTVTVDALWMQPWFSETLDQRLNIDLYTRNIIGLKWEMLGDILSHADNEFQEKQDNFLHLITLKNKSELNIDDLIGMLNTLGSIQKGHFRPALNLMTDLNVEKAPMNQRAGGLLKLVYSLHFKEFDSSFLPLVETFIAHVEKILDSWISDAMVEVRMKIVAAAPGA